MTTSNITPLTDAEFRRRCSKMSEEIFGFGYDHEQDREQIISDAMTLAHSMSSTEVSRFVSELYAKMFLIARMNKRTS